MNPTNYAKAIVGALVAALSALAIAPDFGVRSIITTVIAGLVAFSVVWAVPNASEISRAKKRAEKLGPPPNLLP